MRFGLRSISILLSSCALSVLGSATAAFADPVINGNVYFEGVAPSGPTQGVLPPAPISAPSATFTATGFNFDVPANGSSTLYGFLSSGGQLQSFNCVYDANCGNTTNLNLLYQFTGNTALTAGTTYSVTHDDGIYLYLDGAPVIASPNPTNAITDNFTVAYTGVYSFDLLYTNVNALPAVLESNITPTSAPITTPEPGSFLLMGSGLLAAAAKLRRRRA